MQSWVRYNIVWKIEVFGKMATISVLISKSEAYEQIGVIASQIGEMMEASLLTEGTDGLDSDIFETAKKKIKFYMKYI